MTPSPDALQELRELLDEEIPSGGTEANTAFTDARLVQILASSANIYAAAAEGWRRKAAKLQKKLGDISAYSVGQEKYEYTSLSNALAAALKLASTFDEQAQDKKGIGGMMLGVTQPKIL